MRLKDLSLAGKMGVFIAAVTALNLLAGGWALYEGRQTLMEGKQREVTAIVEAAHSIVADFGARAAKVEATEGHSLWCGEYGRGEDECRKDSIQNGLHIG